MNELKLMGMITYMGEELQIVELELLNEKDDDGKDEILYHCMNRHGEITPLCGWEIELDRKEASGNV